MRGVKQQRRELTVRLEEGLFEVVRDARHKRRLSQQELLMQALQLWLAVNAAGGIQDPRQPRSDEERTSVEALLNLMRADDLDSIGAGLRDVALQGLSLAHRHLIEIRKEH